MGPSILFLVFPFLGCFGYFMVGKVSSKGGPLGSTFVFILQLGSKEVLLLEEVPNVPKTSW
jgi:hypothetical protein